MDETFMKAQGYEIKHNILYQDMDGEAPANDPEL
jgi:hypothetical protein